MIQSDLFTRPPNHRKELPGDVRCPFTSKGYHGYSCKSRRPLTIVVSGTCWYITTEYYWNNVFVPKKTIEFNVWTFRGLPLFSTDNYINTLFFELDTPKIPPWLVQPEMPLPNRLPWGGEGVDPPGLSSWIQLLGWVMGDPWFRGCVSWNPRKFFRRDWEKKTRLFLRRWIWRVGRTYLKTLLP